MNALRAIAVAALVSVGLASAASAAQRTYQPANTSFTASGSWTVTGVGHSLACHTVLTGAIVNGAGSITGASFSGNAACAAVTATGLPWQMLSYGDSGTGINLTHVSLVGPMGGTCGPGRVKGILGVGGKLTIAGAGVPPCSLSGTLATSPHVSIAPK